MRHGNNPPHINPKELDLLDKEPGWVQYVQRSFRGLGHCRTVAKPSKTRDLLAFSADGLGFLSLGLAWGLVDGPDPNFWGLADGPDPNLARRYIFFAVPKRSSAAWLDGTMAANHYNHWLAKRREQGRRTKER